MSIVIWLLTFLLVLDCLILMLLVLIQLPKKEAGLGQAFGGGATDALFGAGSGTALTKLTKYTAGIFFALTLLISMLHGHQARAKANDPRGGLSAEEKMPPMPAAAAAAKPGTPPSGTPLSVTNAAGATGALATATNAITAATNAAATNASAVPAK
jgi:preprotein translocase subunit SecG